MIDTKHTPDVQETIKQISDELDVRSVSVCDEKEKRYMDGVEEWQNVVSIKHRDHLEPDDVAGCFSDEHDLDRDVWVNRTEKYPISNNCCDPNPEYYSRTVFVIVE